MNSLHTPLNANVLSMQRDLPPVAHQGQSSPDISRLGTHGAAAELLADLGAINGLVHLAERGGDISRIGEVFCGLTARLDRLLGAASPLPAPVREELGQHAQRAMIPLMQRSESAERWYSKPRGYAGDFLSIDLIYRDRPCGRGVAGAALDRCFLDLPAAVAVKNRRSLLAEEIRASLAPMGTARVMSLACGPAAELFDVFAALPGHTRLEATLVDIDEQALAFVADKITTCRLDPGAFQLHHANLIHLASGRARLDVPPQDLVYSIGLIDYFSDRWVIALLDHIHGLLRPGGRVILGNFHPRNPTRALMDHVLDWRLIHRSEEDIDRLYAASRFGRPSTRIRFEAQGINLFAECVK